MSLLFCCSLISSCLSKTFLLVSPLFSKLFLLDFNFRLSSLFFLYLFPILILFPTFQLQLFYVSLFSLHSFLPPTNFPFLPSFTSIFLHCIFSVSLPLSFCSHSSVSLPYLTPLLTVSPFQHTHSFCFLILTSYPFLYSISLFETPFLILILSFSLRFPYYLLLSFSYSCSFYIQVISFFSSSHCQFFFLPRFSLFNILFLFHFFLFFSVIFL